MIRKIFSWSLIVLGGLLVFASFIPTQGQQAEEGGKAVLVIGVLLALAGWGFRRKQPKRRQAKGGNPPACNTKNCPECGERLPLDAITCESCGKKQKLGDSTCSGGVNTAAAGRSSFAGERRNAKKVGSTHYIWRSVHDGARCERCANNDGRKFSWDQEPSGGHAGAAARCRCYPEAIIPRS